MKTRFCTMSDSETTSDWNWEVIKGRRSRKARRTLH